MTALRGSRNLLAWLPRSRLFDPPAGQKGNGGDHDKGGEDD